MSDKYIKLESSADCYVGNLTNATPIVTPQATISRQSSADSDKQIRLRASRKLKLIRARKPSASTVLAEHQAGPLKIQIKKVQSPSQLALSKV